MSRISAQPLVINMIQLWRKLVSGLLSLQDAKILSQIVQHQIHQITCCMLIFCVLVLQSMQILTPRLLSSDTTHQPKTIVTCPQIISKLQWCQKLINVKPWFNITQYCCNLSLWLKTLKHSILGHPFETSAQQICLYLFFESLMISKRRQYMIIEIIFWSIKKNHFLVLLQISTNMTILGNEILYYLIIIFHPKYIENAILSLLLLGMLFV